MDSRFLNGLLVRGWVLHGIFFVAFLHHSLILILKTGSVIPLYHLVYDDWFSTISFALSTSLAPALWDQLTGTLYDVSIHSLDWITFKQSVSNDFVAFKAATDSFVHHHTNEVEWWKHLHLLQVQMPKTNGRHRAGYR